MNVIVIGVPESTTQGLTELIRLSEMAKRDSLKIVLIHDFPHSRSRTSTLTDLDITQINKIFQPLPVIDLEPPLTRNRMRFLQTILGPGYAPYHFVRGKLGRARATPLRRRLQFKERDT